MDARQAAGFINGLALKPGWQIDATPADYGRVVLNISFPTFNSNEQYAPTYAAAPFTARNVRTVTVTSYSTPASVTGDVLRLCLETEAHEWQEMLRYQASGRWVAPFHPHRPEGQRNWLTGAARPQLAGSIAA
jgi:hypothetical protein